MQLFEIAENVYGGTQAEGKYDRKDIYDALELAVNQHILEMDNISLDSMQKLLEQLPTQTVRTTEMVEYQQFSTPPSIAYLTSVAANVNSNDTVLEPSAGIGGLAVFAKAEGAEVIVNELSKRRFEILKNMGFDQFFNEDAEQIDNILPDDIKPSVVIMNPPFSSAAERMGNKNNTKNATRHIEQALNRLQPNGRLVAIVGQGMADDAPAFRKWWSDIKKAI